MWIRCAVWSSDTCLDCDAMLILHVSIQMIFAIEAFFALLANNRLVAQMLAMMAVQIFVVFESSRSLAHDRAENTLI